MDIFGPWHLIIVAGVFVMLFGAKRLPDAARSLGKSAHILKSEISSLHHDDDGSAVVSRAHAAGPVSVTGATVPAPEQSAARASQ